MFYHRHLFIVLIGKLMLASLALVVVFGLVGVFTNTKTFNNASPYFMTWLKSVDQKVFITLLAAEQRNFTAELPANHNSKLFEFNQLKDVRAFLRQEIPGLRTYESEIIIAGDGLEETHLLAHESGPPLEDVLIEQKAIDKPEKTEISPSTKQKKQVFIYHSHNRESFLPHLKDATEGNQAYHKEVNITKVGERLGRALEELGVGAQIDKTDIMEELNKRSWTYSQSYQASRPIVETALQKNKSLNYVFDIHRDSIPRDKTTIELAGTTYARPLFVIGAENKNYEKNLALASKLHYALEKKYPKLSKGVITKQGPYTNGVYNQDLAENALLLEVGGYENHLDEMYRTVDIIAEVFVDVILDAEKVSK